MPVERWSKRPLGELLTLEYGAGLPQALRTGEGYPVYGSNGLVGRHSEYLVEGPGIVVGRKGTVGAVVWSDEPFWPIDTTYYVQPKGDTDPRWVYWCLSSLPLSRLDSSTGVPGLNRHDAYALEVLVPTAPQQRRIAEILDAADEAIRQAERLIAKQRAVKAGLLHDLLTRGLDEHGHLRDPQAHPEQFKDSLVGRIPEDWVVHEVEQVVSEIVDFRGKTPRKLGMKWGGDIPALSANNVEMGKINLEKETYYGSEPLYQKWMNQGDVRKGDIIMTMEAPLGNVAQIPDDRKYILSQRVVLLRTQEQMMDDNFLKYQMMSTFFQRQLRINSTGTTAAGIQQAKLRHLKLVVPLIGEQRHIAAVLDAHDARIRAEEAMLAKLRQVKRGLMHDLLTGKVGVKV